MRGALPPMKIRFLLTRFALIASVWIALGLPAFAQPIRVGSVFVRYTPTGEMFPQDRVSAPMEALSPPLVRGMWNSFGSSWTWNRGQPSGSSLPRTRRTPCRPGSFGRLCRRTHRAGRWSAGSSRLCPSAAVPPRNGARPKPHDLHVLAGRAASPNFPSQRLKLEAQALIQGQWFLHPMEIRVVDLSLPASPPGQADLPLGTLGPHGGSPSRVVRNFVCAAPEAKSTTLRVPEGSEASLEAHAARAFDFALDALALGKGRDAVQEVIGKFLGYKDRQVWCAKPVFPGAAYGSEWPAILQNRLLRMRGNPY